MCVCACVCPRTRLAQGIRACVRRTRVRSRACASDLDSDACVRVSPACTGTCAGAPAPLPHPWVAPRPPSIPTHGISGRGTPPLSIATLYFSRAWPGQNLWICISLIIETRPHTFICFSPPVGTVILQTITVEKNSGEDTLLYDSKGVTAFSLPIFLTSFLV